MVRSARQFLYHARFAPEQPPGQRPFTEHWFSKCWPAVPAPPSPADRRIVILGYASLHALSSGQVPMLKAACGGAWQSYVLRSHWRMVFPFSPAHQSRTAKNLAASVQRGGSPILHLVKFPALTINHGIFVFAMESAAAGFKFLAYDPNQPQTPVELTFQRRSQSFSLPANA